MRVPEPIGRPIRISGPQGPWQQLSADLALRGTALVYARSEDWRPQEAAGPRLRRLLGRDWNRYLDLARPDVRNRFAASRILLKYAAGEALQVPPDSVELGYRTTGRPYLRGNDALDISLSHTDGLLLVGLTTRGFVGVDVEDARREFYEAGLARHWCTPAELAWVDALPPARRDPELVRLWTLKEAYTKALGLGMQLRFTDFGFRLDRDPVSVYGVEGQDPGGPGGQLPHGPTGEDGWSFATFPAGADHTLSVAVYDAGFGRTEDTAVHTMLETTIVDAVALVLGEEEQGSGADDAW
ncbi:4'-phosphopantetheinyl transferase family protein [Streptacidiphilus jiangxiensis]|uniref:4'-phosphopantetheinyl transferase family protein n=1 Tax=Streptacidiphilus jiangxiensis TaxID=235985 RepID=UPI0005A6B048|nr:4'-phosphopantetheinyl transferase superfamily protein [Streptacidiphilus jiangxiensis]